MSTNETEAPANTQVAAEEPAQQVRKVWNLWGEAFHIMVPWNGAGELLAAHGG